MAFLIRGGKIIEAAVVIVPDEVVGKEPADSDC